MSLEPRSDTSSYLKAASLIPFKNDSKISLAPLLDLKARVELREDILSIEYLCEGDLTDLKIPSVSKTPARKDQLWKEMCFEAFLSFGDNPSYWELNLSPSGDWNLYFFNNYRQGMTVENRISSIDKVIVKLHAKAFKVKILLDLSPLISEKSALHLGVTAVIQKKDLSTSYWALAHKGEEPDFHLRSSFLLQLETGLSRL